MIRTSPLIENMKSGCMIITGSLTTGSDWKTGDRKAYNEWSILMLNSLSNNPIPTVLVGLGLYWLWKDSPEGFQVPRKSYEDGSSRWRNHEIANPSMEDVKDTLQTAKDTVEGHLTELKDQASQQAQEWQRETGQKIQDVKGYFKEKGTVARGEFRHLLDSNPLAVGAVMVALGAVVAAAIPGSRKEDEWMGDSRDKMMDAVKTTVRTTAEDVAQNAGQVAEKVFQKEESTTP